MVTLDSKIKKFNEFDVSSNVRQKGRVLAAYSVPILAVTSLRMVLRPHIGRNAAELLVGEIVDACKISREIRRQRHTADQMLRTVAAAPANAARMARGLRERWLERDRRM
ncbi:hypothetical protein RI103_25490 [Paraburkholderia sp. FT54]|uniref:hypothetical protein n=1 Tax=Paraburkholderia sp. FT54 TaxID=3074437 RepID=UPI0028774B86|nr:hypothetical protein [Paraburkholderia sp. FT54]WNC94121.1 hypothetical protein RI103_25490 [Paraburkholderia sp. FT54]